MKNSMHRYLSRAVCISLAAGLVVGCGDKRDHYVDPNRGEGVVNVDEINIQDFNHAAQVLTQKMLDSKNFQDELHSIAPTLKAREKPLVLVTKIKNDSRFKFNSEHMLAGPIEETLQESGKVEFVTDDEGSRETAKGHDIMSGTSPKLPDMTLHGWIDELDAVAGKTRQATYIFHLKLSGPRGTTVWQGQEQVTKQGKKASVGF